MPVFSTEYVYPEWFTEKNLNFYRKKLEHLQKLRYVHSEAANYYDKLHLKIYFPSITITGLSGIVSFLSSSSLFTEQVQTGLAIGVGVLASVSAVIQSIASAVDYSTKSKAHREAGEEYEKLMTKVEFEMEMPNEPTFADDLENLILEIQNKCTYAPPKHIVESYEGYLHKKSRKINKYRSSIGGGGDDAHSLYSTMSSNNKQTVINVQENEIVEEKKEHVIDFGDLGEDDRTV